MGKNFLIEKLGTDNYNAWTFEKDRLDEETNETTPIEGGGYLTIEISCK